MTTQQTKVDWARPIEAVHVTSGKTYPATWTQAHGGRLVEFNGNALVFVDAMLHDRFGWRIRNVAQPEAPTPSPELTARMVAAILRHVACKTTMFDNEEGPNLSVEAEFRAIAAELEPADGDLIEARKIAVTFKSGERIRDEVLCGAHDSEEAVSALLVAIKRGRALAEAKKCPTHTTERGES